MSEPKKKREVLRDSGFRPAATYRRELGKAHRSEDLQPSNLSDTQEGAVVNLFRTLARKPYGSQK